MSKTTKQPTGRRSRRPSPATGSPRPITRASLIAWALKGVSTEHLGRLLALDENICQMVARLRQEKQSAQFALERLQKDYDGLLVGHRRWREEAVSLHKSNEAARRDTARLDAVRKLDLTVGRCNGSWLAWGKRTNLMDAYASPRQAIDAAMVQANKEVSDAGPLTPELKPKSEPGIR